MYYGMGGVLARIAMIGVGHGVDARAVAGRLFDGVRIAAARAGSGRLFDFRLEFGFPTRARIRCGVSFQAEKRRTANFLKIVLASDR